AGVVAQLLAQPGVPVGVKNAFENLQNQFLLLLGEKVAIDRRLGDVPVVRDMGAEQAAAILVVPVEADGFLLLVGQLLVEGRDMPRSGGRRFSAPSSPRRGRRPSPWRPRPGRRRARRARSGASARQRAGSAGRWTPRRWTRPGAPARGRCGPSWRRCRRHPSG